MITLTGQDNHFVVFSKEKSKESDKKLKNMRRFQTKNTDAFLKLKYWILRDENFAKKLGIDTEGAIGDLYLIKECTKSNMLDATVNLDGKEIHVKKVNNISDVTQSTKLYIDIVSIVLAFPVVVHDFMTFAQFYTKYQSPAIIIYCDKNHPDYEKILAEAHKSRREFSLKLIQKDSKGNPNKDLDHNLLYIVSTQPMLIPLLKLADKSPRVILAIPEHDSSDVIDLRDNYWKHIQKIDGFSKDAFFKKVEDKSYMQESDEDKRESAKAKFSEDRFKLSKNYSFSGEITAKAIRNLINNVKENKAPYFFESEVTPETTYAERIVGEDFKKKIMLSQHDCVLLVEHPHDDENKNYAEKYERFVKNNKDKTKAVKFYRMSDINESDVFKVSNYDSPTVLYFKKGSKESPTELDIKRDLALKSTNKQAWKRLEQFVFKNVDS